MLFDILMNEKHSTEWFRRDFRDYSHVPLNGYSNRTIQQWNIMSSDTIDCLFSFHLNTQKSSTNSSLFKDRQFPIDGSMQWQLFTSDE